MKKKDNIFDSKYKAHDFIFDEKVASVFDDMVSRSVPMYKESMMAAVSLSKSFVKPKSKVYDIGCSTGTLLIKFAELFGEKTLELIGIDSSQDMLNEAKKKILKTNLKPKIILKKQDVEKKLNITKASIVFMNYTLQFMRPLNRQKVLNQIFLGMKNNSALIIIEKVLGNDSLFNRMYIDLYFRYKASVGYSDLEIKNKRESLENVLIPYRIDENIELLKRSGFKSIDIFFKWFNWSGIIAVKN